MAIYVQTFFLILNTLFNVDKISKSDLSKKTPIKFKFFFTLLQLGPIFKRKGGFKVFLKFVTA